MSHLFSIIGRVSLGAARRAGEGEGTLGGLLPVLLIMGLILANGLWAGRSCAADGDEVTIRSLQDSEGGRLLIEWLAPIKVLQKKDDNRLILRFSRPLSDDPGPALDRLATYLDVERTTIEATDLVLVMKPDVSANLEIRKRRIVAIDFRREKITLADVTLNLSTLPNGMRLALDWPQLLGFEAAEEEGRLLAIFKSENRISDADLTYLNTTLQPWFREVRQARDPAGTSLSFDLQPMIVSSVRDDGAGRVIIDLTRDAMALADKSRTTIVPALRPKPPPAPSAEPDENPPPIPKRRPPVTEASTAAGDAEPTEKALSAADDPVVDELVLDWGGKVASAVFKRAGHLWVVVDALPEASKIPLPPPAPLPLMDGELLPADGATVMRFRLQTDRGFKIGRDATGRLHIRPDSETEAPSPVSIAPADRPGSLRATAASGGRLVDVIDPLVGDQLSIWTIQDLDIGQRQRRRFVDLEFLPSLQGLVWRPFNDDIIVRTLADGIEFSSERGLALSSGAYGSPTADAPAGPTILAAEHRQDHHAASENKPASASADQVEASTEEPEEIIAPPVSNERKLAAVEKQAAVIEPSSYLDLVAARVDRELVAETRRILRQAIAKAPPEDRARARLRLARLLVAEQLASEAKIVLQGIAEDEKGAIAASSRALRGASAFLKGELGEAGLLLRASEFDGDKEIGIWRAALESLDKNWQTAAEGWKAASASLDDYPSKLRLELGLLALESAIETNDDMMMRKGFRRLRELDLKPYDQAKIDRLQALRAVRDGDLVKAEQILKSLAESRYPGLSVAADFERVLLGLNQKPNDPVLLAALRERVPLWRGHPQEIDMIDRLARRYRAAKEPREALTLWQHLALIHPETDDDPSIREPRQATYTEAIKTLAGQEIELLDAYAIYLDFIDLLPSAPDARLVHRSLANHLAGLDLLSEALVVLQPLFESATDESEKAEIGSKMAALLLVQGRPQEALAILERAKAGSVASSGDLAARWQIMSARALARLDREDEALRQIRDLQTADARQVRAEIFWHLRNWSRLAGVIESYLDDPALSIPLEEDDQKLVLWLALAREQLSQTRGLDELRRRYAADMASGPWSEAFLVATQVDNEAADVMSTLAQAERQLAELKRFRDDTRANP